MRVIKRKIDNLDVSKRVDKKRTAVFEDKQDAQAHADIQRSYVYPAIEIIGEVESDVYCVPK